MTSTGHEGPPHHPAKVKVKVAVRGASWPAPLSTTAADQGLGIVLRVSSGGLRPPPEPEGQTDIV